jgi:quinol monooxygenase YgiN
MIFIVVKQRVRPEYADDWPSLMEPFTTATRAEPGNLWFDWYRSADEPDVWLLNEAFRDGAGQAHVESAHFRAAAEQLPKLLAATPEVIYFEPPGDGWARMAEVEIDEAVPPDIDGPKDPPA